AAAPHRAATLPGRRRRRRSAEREVDDRGCAPADRDAADHVAGQPQYRERGTYRTDCEDDDNGPTRGTDEERRHNEQRRGRDREAYDRILGNVVRVKRGRSHRLRVAPRIQDLARDPSAPP